MKGIIPLGAVALTAVLVFLANKKLSKGRQCLDLPRKRLACTAVLFLVVFGSAYYFCFPERLQITSYEIQELKAANRLSCQAELNKGNVLEAEALLGGTSVHSKRMAADFSNAARRDIDRLIRPIVNRVFINGLGVACATVPFYFMLMAVLLQSMGVSIPGVSDRTVNQPRFVDLIRTGSVYGTVWVMTSFLVYFLFVEPYQYEKCIEISGHWFMYTVTTGCMMFLSVILWSYNVSNTGSMYMVLVGLYQAMVLKVLKSTQQFYHDKEEALEGIKFGILCVVVCAFVCVAFLSVVEDPNEHNRGAEKILQSAEVDLNYLPPPPESDDDELLPPPPELPEEETTYPTSVPSSAHTKSPTAIHPFESKRVDLNVPPTRSRKSQEPASTNPTPGGLLGEIQKGKKLKSSPTPAKSDTASEMSGIYNSINAMVEKRRAAVKADSDDDWN
eukprot:CFRG8253T1